jgi:hypothetical protein
MRRKKVREDFDEIVSSNNIANKGKILEDKATPKTHIKDLSIPRCNMQCVHFSRHFTSW